jgi:hypothetical protein
MAILSQGLDACCQSQRADAHGVGEPLHGATGTLLEPGQCPVTTAPPCLDQGAAEQSIHQLWVSHRLTSSNACSTHNTLCQEDGR